MSETPSDLQVEPNLGVGGDIRVLGPEHAECVAAYNLLREELATRTAELEQSRIAARRRDALDEVRHDTHRVPAAHCPLCPPICCDNPRPFGDPGEPDEFVKQCGSCGEDMDEEMLDLAARFFPRPSPGPRVWKKGDPEPPSDVVLLRNIGERSDELPYLRRYDGGWRWVGSPTEEPTGRWWSWGRISTGAVLTEVIQDGFNPDGGADG